MTAQTQNPLTYIVERTKTRGIEMHCKCDGEVFYAGLESTDCPYSSEGKPHAIYQSELVNGRRLVIVDEPDFSRPGKNTPGGEVLGSVYTFKVIRETEDIHKSNGQHAIRVRPDGSIERVHGMENSQDPKTCIDFLVESFLR